VQATNSNKLALPAIRVMTLGQALFVLLINILFLCQSYSMTVWSNFEVCTN
jgi:hypothetical protein